MMAVNFLCTVFAISLTAAAPIPKYNFLVVLDPGHGGEDNGTVQKLGDGKVAITEKEITLELANRIANQLRRHNIHVALTRTSDQTVLLDERTAIANSAAQMARNSVFISLHVNSSPDSQSSGIETYVFNAATNEASKHLAERENSEWEKLKNHYSDSVLDLILADLTSTGNFKESFDLASAIQKNVTSGLNKNHYPTRNRGVRQALFYVLMQTKMPSILLEPGFASNPAELKELLDPKYQQTLAVQISKAIIKWSKASHTTPKKHHHYNR
jgi:N-acetylmuramoyl-L-alanine amidase